MPTCPKCSRPLAADAKDGLCPACVAAQLFEGIFADAMAAEEPSASSNRCIGPYELVERIGEGAFGEVFRAEQRQPVKRTVALKILKQGMDTRQIIARFEAERQALALMDHPNIAKVFDAGATPEGRPYFVMEFVAGEPITRYCQEHTKDLRSLLEVFLQVCAAVHHAHQKGVIHRDLKPSNILVTSGEEGVAPGVRLIDFGIARAVATTLTDRTLFTHFHQVLGTPEYMSPEQALSGGVDVDVRSDVYSLGAVLYELLAGTTPFRESRGAARQTELELMRRQREEEPARPSTRITTSHPEAGPPEHHQAFAKALRNELDWIALKALAKRREDRYASAGELADDIRAYLEGRPVKARPPNRLYELGKFVRRHSALATALALTVAGLLTSAVISLRSANHANAARAEAEAARHHALEVYSQSDLRVADQLVDAGHDAEAVAYMCRALRTDPDNRLAATRLITTLAYSSLPPMLQEPLLHPTTVYRLFVSPDEQHLVTNCADGKVYVWQRSQPQQPRFVWSCQPRLVALSPVSNLLVVGTQTRRVLVWQLHDGQSVPLAHDKLAGDVSAVAFSEDASTLYAADNKGSVTAWDLATHEVRWSKPLPGSGAFAHAIATSPARSRTPMIALGLSDGRVVFTDPDGTLIAERSKFPPDPDKGIERLLWHSDGVHLAAGHGTGMAVILNVQNPAGDSVLMTHQQHIHDLKFSPNGRLLATCGYDHRARLWQMSGKPYSDWMEHNDDVYALTFAPDGKTLATASRDAAARLWSTSPAATLSTRPLRHEFSVNGVAFLDEGRTLVTASRDGRVRFWDVRTRGYNGPLRSIQSAKPISRARFDPGGQQASPLSKLGSWLLMHSMETRPWHAFAKGRPSAVATNPDADFVLAWDGNHARAWSAKSEALGPAWQAPSKISAAALTPDGTRVLLGLTNGELVICRNDTGAVMARRGLAHYRSITAVEISADGLLAVTASADMTARLWDLPNLTPRGAIMSHADAITHLALSPAGNVVGTGCMNNTARVWSAVTGVPLTPPLRHEGHALEGCGIICVFDSTGHRLITAGSHDLTARVWSVATGRELIAPLKQGNGVIALAVSPDDNWLATGDVTSEARVWDLRTGLTIVRQSMGVVTLDRVAFNRSNDRLLVARSRQTKGQDGQGRDTIQSIDVAPSILALPNLAVRLPPWFIDYAETWFGRRFNADNVLESVPFAEFRRARQTAENPPPGTPAIIARWAKLLTSDSTKLVDMP